MAQDERDLRGVLRGEADRHHPDRAAMLERIERGRAARRAPRATGLHRLLRRDDGLYRPGGPLRPVAAAAAVAAVLVAAVTGLRMSGGAPETEVAGAPSASPATARPAPATSTPGPRHSTRPAPHRPSSGPLSGPPGHDAFLAARGVLDAHSIPSWSQQNLTVALTEPATALTVTIRIARTPGVARTGAWTSIPRDMVTTSVTEEDAALVYRFRLRTGTLQPGDRYVFAAQFNHAPRARALTGDTYAVSATASGRATVTGGFTRG